MLKHIAAALAAASLFGCRCGSTPGSSGSGSSGEAEEPSTNTEVAAKAPSSIPNTLPPLQFSEEERARTVTSKDRAIGAGAAVAANSVIEIKYEIRLANEAVVDDGHPAATTITVGYGTLPKPVEAAIEGMRAGGTRVISVPFHLAYGHNQMGKIPPDSDLTFEVTLDKIVEQ